MARVAVATLLLTALAGCKHAAPPTLRHDLPPTNGFGWTLASDPESGVSLSLPPGWRVGLPKAFDPNTMTVDPNVPAAVGETLRGMAGEAGGDVAGVEKAQLATMREKEGIVLHCVDGSKPTIAEEPTRLYVKRTVGAGYGSLDDAVAAEKSDAHREMKGGPADLPVGKAYRLVAQGRNRIGDEECHVSYVFVDGPDAYVLRFSSTNAPDAIMGIEKSVAETFRVAKGR